MKQFLILAFFCLPAQVFGQELINKSKTFVRNKIEKYNPGVDSLRTSFSETDSTIQLSVRSQSSPYNDFIYSFDKKGNCSSEKKISYTETHFRQLLKQALDLKNYDWKRINENQYVSKFSEKMLIELPGDAGIYSFTIIRTDWNKATYELITRSY